MAFPGARQFLSQAGATPEIQRTLDTYPKWANFAWLISQAYGADPAHAAGLLDAAAGELEIFDRAAAAGRAILAYARAELLPPP